MANQHKAQVEIELRDKIYKLEFTSNAFAELEDQLNEPMWAILDKASKSNAYVASYKFVRAALWAGLQEDAQGCKLNIKQVGRMVTPDNYKTVLETVVKAFTLGLPKAEAQEEDASAPSPLEPNE